MVISIVFQWNY